MKALTRFAAPGISLLWSSVNWARSRAYRVGWISSQRVDPIVISVGNIQAGGAGKTPVVAWIAEQGRLHGLRVAILLRGYGGNLEQSGGVISPSTSDADYRQFGDEAVLLSRLAPAAWIGVGADRRKSLAEVSRQAKIDWVILDDGFQNYQLRRDLNIVLLSTESHPRIYRDFHARVREADLILWTKGEIAPETFGRPVCRLQLEPDESTVADVLRAGLVCGIADPNPVVKFLGTRLSHREIFPDHHDFTSEEITRIREELRARDLIPVTTGKDWVKIRGLIPADEQSRWRVLEPRVRVTWGAEVWERVLGKYLPRAEGRAP